MSTRRPVAPDGVGGLSQIVAPDFIDGSILPAIYPFTEQGSAPATPAAGTLDVYAKTDHLLYIKDSTGTETPVGSGGSSGGPVAFAFFT